MILFFLFKIRKCVKILFEVRDLDNAIIGIIIYSFYHLYSYFDNIYIFFLMISQTIKPQNNNNNNNLYYHKTLLKRKIVAVRSNINCMTTKII